MRWFALLCIVLALSGCSLFARGSVPPGGGGDHPHGLFATLASVGGTFTTCGLVVAGVALVACLTPLRPIAVIVAELGSGSALVGGFFVWLSDHPWLVVLSCVLTGVAYGWYRRAWLRRWFDRIKTKVVKP